MYIYNTQNSHVKIHTYMYAHRFTRACLYIYIHMFIDVYV